MSLAIERQKLELGIERQKLELALAMGTNTSFLDGLYKNQATMDTSGLQLAKELDS